MGAEFWFCGCLFAQNSTSIWTRPIHLTVLEYDFFPFGHQKPQSCSIEVAIHGPNCGYGHLFAPNSACVWTQPVHLSILGSDFFPYGHQKTDSCSIKVAIHGTNFGCGCFLATIQRVYGHNQFIILYFSTVQFFMLEIFSWVQQNSYDWSSLRPSKIKALLYKVGHAWAEFWPWMPFCPKFAQCMGTAYLSYCT